MNKRACFHELAEFELNARTLSLQRDHTRVLDIAIGSPAVLRVGQVTFDQLGVDR